MAVSTKRFTLTTSAYQDISEGNAVCSLRIPLISQRNNSVRIALGTSLPSPNATDYDTFAAPDTPREEFQVHFLELTSADRVYARAEAGSVIVAVYRK